MEFTEEQRRAIDARDTNLLLSAAAGSGKTTVLVERVLDLIRKDGADVDRMLIVTFTRAAAADMRAKLIRSLSGDAKLSRQLRALERASITTLHGFCADFLRSNFEAAGVDPAFRVLDDAESRRMFDDALDEAMEEAYAAGGDALLALDYGRGAEGVRAAAEALCAFLRERPDPWAWLDMACTYDDTILERWIRELTDSARSALNRARMYLDMAISMPKCPAKYADAIEKDLSELERISNIAEYDPLFRALTDFTPARASGRREDVDEAALEEVKRLRDDAKTAIQNIAMLDFPLRQSVCDAKAMCQNLTALGGICRRAEELFAQRKEERAGLTYSDLEQKTLAALRDDETAEETRAKYDYVFVDEYQDTSDVQEALISRLAREDNLFMVGDVKQSIYRFRHAEPRLFLEKYSDYGRGAHGALLALTRNFRSSPSIIHFVNLVFERLMSGGDAEITYDELARLNPGNPDAEAGEPVEMHCISSVAAEDEEAQELTAAQREGAFIARRIKELMAQDPTLRYRDIAILTRAGRSAFTPMLPMLLAADIPAYADGSEGYYDAMEVILALELLKLVANERSDVEWIGVLRSGIGGLSAEELAEIRIRSPHTAYVDAIRLAAMGEDALAEKVRRILDMLSGLRLRMGSMGLGDLTRYAMNESGLYLYVGALPNGRQRQANLDLLADSAEKFDRDISGSLTRFLRYTEELRSKGDGDAAHMLGENDDVVRLMTVHKSKGLEFRVVFGALLHRKFRAPDATRPILAHSRLGAGMEIYDEALRTRRKTLPWAAIAQREIREGYAEELRILYVLLTRAKERLILSATVRNPDTAQIRWNALGGALSAANSHLDCVMGAVFRAKREGMEAGMEFFSHTADEFAMPVSQDDDGQALQAFDEALAHPERYEDEALVEQLSWQYPDENASRRPLKLTVSGLLRELEGPEAIAPMAERPKFLEAQSMTGTERGSAYHRALQFLDFSALTDCVDLVGNIRVQLDDMEREQRLEHMQREVIRPSKLAIFLNSPLGRRLLHGENIHREWAFNVLMRANEVLDAEESPVLDGSLIVQGVIDCCFMENGKWILLDYKTDRGDDLEELTRRYRRQLGVYALALERITGIPVAEQWLCLIGAEKQIPLTME